MEDLPNLNCDHQFDTDGNHISTNIINVCEDDTSVLAVHLAKWETHHPDEFLTDTQAASLIANPIILRPSPQNIARLKPNFGWIPENLIEQTLQKTTQLYRHNPMECTP